MRHETGHLASFLTAATFLLAATLGCSNSTEVSQANPSAQQAPGKNRVDVGAVTPIPVNEASPAGSSEIVRTGAEMPLNPNGSGTSNVQPVAMPSEIAMMDASEEEAEKPKFSRRELFEGWNKPQIALFLTGQQHGYIEPCGCTGLDNQKGGLMRRQTFLNQLRNDRGWDVVALDVGNQVRRFGRQAEIKFQTTAEGLKKMDYEAVSFGPDDLRLSVDEVFAAVASEDPDNIKYISSNASLLGFTPKHRIVEAGGKKIGITGVLGSKEQQKISNSEVEMGDPMQELEASWNALKAENCDLYVLLSHATLEESRQYAKAFPGFQIVVTAGGAGEPTLKPENIEGTNTQMIQVGTKGMYVGVVGLFNDPQQPIRYERVALDARFEDSEEMLRLLASYQKQLETLGLDGLGIRPQPHSSGHSFVGSETCAECHSEAYEVWENSKHSHATDTLVHPPERFEVPRHFDPECLACHVTGWNPELYLPYRSGYLGLEATPNMKSVGCENCHGPGSHHVASQNGEGGFSDEQTAMFVDQMKLPLEAARDTCLKCHDLDNSPDFHVKGAFEKYWEEIKH